jgi:diguanylate cyclase (GGDEF)-like protein/PAS domain S-box-containing protein
MIYRTPTRQKPLALIVDDDLSMRLAMQAALHKVGFDSVLADNGRSGIEKFVMERPDLVLLDVVMPEVNGFDTCKEIRSKHGGEFVQILMVTGLDDVESTELAFKVGADGFVSKPINWVMLGHRARYMLRAGHAFQELNMSRFRLEKTQKIAKLGNWEIDLMNGEFTCSKQARELLGLTEEDALVFEQFFMTISGAEQDAVRDKLSIALQKKKPFRVSYKVIHPDGSQRHILNQGEILVNEKQNPILLLGAVQDVTVQKMAEEEIKKLAFYDSLTGLSNRLLFMNRLSQEIVASKRNGTQFALLYLDLDQFKRINDTFGHYIGDLLLKKIAGALQHSIRGTDIASRLGSEDPEKRIARLGGDEFTVILSDISEIEHVAMVARRIIKEVPQSYIIEGNEITVTTSMGISMYPVDGLDGDILLKHADTAMYQAKNSGRNNFQFYKAELNAQAVERFSLERDISRALDREEFILYYQPKLEVSTRRIVGAEALIRWQHPERGIVPPGVFIPIAEESGQIVAINRWVVETASRQWQKWREAGLAPGVVAVNLSGYQFAQQKVLETISVALEKSGLDAEFLEIEITENVFMQNIQEAATILQQLKEMGIRVSLDDFGTGYSSFSYLSSFKVDTLKIDRSFVMNCIEQPKNLIIIKAIIAMGHSLGIKIVAEGVETSEQLAIIGEYGADEAQGYYFSRPVPPEELVDILKKKVL